MAKNQKFSILRRIFLFGFVLLSGAILAMGVWGTLQPEAAYHALGDFEWAMDVFDFLSTVAGCLFLFVPILYILRYYHRRSQGSEPGADEYL